MNTVEDAKADLAAVRGPKYGDCLITAFRDDLRRQAGVTIRLREKQGERMADGEIARQPEQLLVLGFGSAIATVSRFD